MLQVRSRVSERRMGIYIKLLQGSWHARMVHWATDWNVIGHITFRSLAPRHLWVVCIGTGLVWSGRSHTLSKMGSHEQIDARRCCRVRDGVTTCAASSPGVQIPIKFGIRKHLSGSSTVAEHRFGRLSRRHTKARNFPAGTVVTDYRQ